MNKTFINIRGKNVNLDSKTIGILFFIIGIIMMFMPQTKSIGPFIIGASMGYTFQRFNLK